MHQPSASGKAARTANQPRSARNVSQVGSFGEAAHCRTAAASPTSGRFSTSTCADTSSQVTPPDAHAARQLSGALSGSTNAVQRVGIREFGGSEDRQRDVSASGESLHHAQNGVRPFPCWRAAQHQSSEGVSRCRVQRRGEGAVQRAHQTRQRGSSLVLGRRGPHRLRFPVAKRPTHRHEQVLQGDPVLTQPRAQLLDRHVGARRSPAPLPGADLTLELWAGGDLTLVDLPATLPVRRPSGAAVAADQEALL